MPIEPIDALELALERAESMAPQPVTLSSTLCEIYRISKRGFTDSEATYWADRLDRLMAESL